MLDNIIEDRDFAALMQKSVEGLIIYLFEKDEHFGILCKIENITFEPPLPREIASEFRAMTLFFLAGYTFETANIIGENLIFEAGFGSDNFGSIVTVPLHSIVQIIVDETPLLINLSNYKKEIEKVKVAETLGVENSMASFLSNPENSKFLKK
ncbi:conserved hypothetical protein [Sulfurimonas denitrificans DSM 1251]|uniref:Uncharacterized protein n=1 Tax=Sulfurimonas denitrificans (strain ATCC 33889 / DSM 1251) TaxID=326298 RepID=Q30TG5_SULDN|nr:hypothetical protein [Sulfurimonas denitrificans]ABB43716.1 conserved hypothetical protein [Sulfurimonas denitrificans DSM 1251]MDD3442739.1 hypothetical protein [Sulfurimonas denitrificans]